MVCTWRPDHVGALARPVAVIWAEDGSAVAVAPRPGIEAFANGVNGMVVRIAVVRSVRIVFGVFARQREALGESLLGAVVVRQGAAELNGSREQQMGRGELHLGPEWTAMVRTRCVLVVVVTAC